MVRGGSLRCKSLLVRLVSYKTLVIVRRCLCSACTLPEPVAEGEALKCTAALPSERRSASLKR